ncbi:MAG TPA: RidA family protein [Vicinamibacterales bacterium]|nr:RidA family protein [Vicinamibacterales bacterium]
MRLTLCLLASFVLTAGVTARQADRPITRLGHETGLPISRTVQAGRFIYAAGTMGTTASGALAAGGIQGQTRQALENLATALKAAGSDLAHAVSVTVYLRHQSDFQAMNAAYRTFWPTAPPTRTTVVTELARPDSLVEISMIAVPRGAERAVIAPAGWLPSPFPYSYAIKSGDTLFLSGLVSRDVRTNEPRTGDITVQTRTILDHARDLLQAAGFTPRDVVQSRVFLPDRTNFRAMNAVYTSVFTPPPPARAAVQTQLSSPDDLVEITLVAVKGGHKQFMTQPNPDGTPGRPNPILSAAVHVGDRLYLSGTPGAVPAGHVAASTRDSLARLGRSLKAAGFDWNNVVDAIVYLRDVRQFKAMNDAYRQVFHRDFPARTTVQAASMGPSDLEIMLTAVK